MTMKNYTYTGTQSYHVTIGGKDVFMEPNKYLELPSENSYIRSMIASGLLVEVAEQQTVAEPAEPQQTETKPKRNKSKDK